MLGWWKEPTGHLDTLSQWILETDCSWVDLFLTALLRLRMTPQSHGSSPYIIVYGRPPPIIKQVSTNMSQVREDEISQQMEQLCKVINQETKFVQERVPFPLREQIPEFVPRDQVWSRTGNTTPWPHIGRVRILLL